jgi:PTH1 family peptidyl-tRNA hydrolase
MAADKLAQRWGVDSLWRSAKNNLTAEVRKAEKIILVKPQTYMNLSGQAVAALMNWHKIGAENVIVIYDDASLPAGKLRLRIKGSSGGHNGIESLIENLGTDAFLRIKIGVGHPPEGWDLADYVLGKFTKEEQTLFDKVLEQTADAVEYVLKHGVAEAMNKFN